MLPLLDEKKGTEYLFMGNEAIVRGALEAGVSVAAGYPGTPSSEIIENLSKVAKDRNIYVEWSVNEKVALEVAASGSFAGLRSLCSMKQNGVNVASDFLLHLAGSGTRAGMVLITCDDPGALSSINEGESRHFAKMVEIPLLEPGDFQEAKDMTKWAFELSDELKTIVMMRSVTRLSHASGNVTLGELPKPSDFAGFQFSGNLLDSQTGPVITAPVSYRHGLQQSKINKAMEIFETSPFNKYQGPDNPELLIITSSACSLYCKEAVTLLDLSKRVGILKLGTTWPLPRKLLTKHLKSTDKILIVEEVIPFLEDNVKILAAEIGPEIGAKTFLGKQSGIIPSNGELNPDIVTDALKFIFSIDYTAMSPEYEFKSVQLAFSLAPNRELTFCPGCPHRASFWSIHNAITLDNREGFVCGDIGCYTMAILPCGFNTLKTCHSMGSGTGTASGFGKLRQFGMEQPVLAVCGDSTFYHTAIPALVNAVHHKSDIVLVVLDNSGTAMTGFQPHPGLDFNAMGQEVPAINITDICRAIGADVKTCDPFDLENTQKTLLELIEAGGGAKVLILKQICALSPEKKGKKRFEVSVNSSLCKGENCGCNRLCTRIFRCPGLVWDKEKQSARIDEVICAGCGVCSDICPSNAISREEVL